MTATAEYTTYFTGFCGLRADAASHGRCPLQLRSGERVWTCTCTCHTTPPAEEPAPVAPVRPVPALISGTGGELPPVEYDLGDALLHLTESVDVLGRALLDFDGSDVETLDLLGQVRLQRQALAQIEAVLETTAVRLMTQDVVTWDGGTAERRWGKDRKEWKHDDLARAVTGRIVEQLAVDPTSGVFDGDLAAVLHQAVEQYAATNRPSWRVTAVKPLGIDPDEFCVAVPGRATVQVNLSDGPQ